MITQFLWIFSTTIVSFKEQKVTKLTAYIAVTLWGTNIEYVFIDILLARLTHESLPHMELFTLAWCIVTLGPPFQVKQNYKFPCVRTSMMDNIQTPLQSITIQNPKPQNDVHIHKCPPRMEGKVCWVLTHHSFISVSPTIQSTIVLKEPVSIEGRLLTSNKLQNINLFTLEQIFTFWEK